jgi:hypothetical protein
LERDFLSRCRCWSMDSSSDVNYSWLVVTKKAAAVTATSINGKNYCTEKTPLLYHSKEV